MSLAGLLQALAADDGIASAVRTLRAADAPIEVAVPVGLRAPLVVLAGPAEATTLVVTATAREAEDLAAAIGSFLPPDAVATFPSWETLPHERLSPRSDTVGRRLAADEPLERGDQCRLGARRGAGDDRRAATLSGGAWRCCVGSRTRMRRTRRWTGRGS